MGKLHKKSFNQNLATAAMDEDVSFRFDYQLVAILFHASASLTDTTTVKYISDESGSNYDVELDSKAFAGAQHYTYIPNSPLKLRSEEKINISCTDSTSAIVYVTVIVEAL